MKKLIIIIVSMVICTINLKAQHMFSVRQLTFDPAREGFPSWSPDGETIVYQLSNRNDTIGENGLWKISQDGTRAEQIFCGIAEHPKWSPDGRYIVFDADTGQNIKLLPAEGGDPIIFLPDTIQIDKGGLPCWSPDALQIAFKDAGSSLCIYNIKTGEITRIFWEEGMILLPGCWTVDGKHILVALMDSQSRKSTIWKISSDGEKRIQITGHHENFYRHLASSPDGSLLVYAVMEGRFLGFYIMLMEEGISIPLAVTSETHYEGPSWSPDGKKIAFSRSGSRSVDVWIMEVDIEQVMKEFQLHK